MKTLLFILLVLLVGSLLPIQATINAQVGALLRNPFYGTFVNFLVGTVGVTILLALLRPQLPTLQEVSAVPFYYYLGGLIGIMLVTTLVITVPKIGATNALMALVVGQMLISIIIDHNGWLGVPENAASPSRLTGAALLLLGLYLIQRTG
jgi:transporter family-2 protein